MLQKMKGTMRQKQVTWSWSEIQNDVISSNIGGHDPTGQVA